MMQVSDSILIHVDEATKKIMERLQQEAHLGTSTALAGLQTEIDDGLSRISGAVSVIDDSARKAHVELIKLMKNDANVTDEKLSALRMEIISQLSGQNNLIQEVFGSTTSPAELKSITEGIDQCLKQLHTLQIEHGNGSASVLQALVPLSTLSEVKAATDAQRERLSEIQGLITSKYQKIESRSEEEHSRLTKTIDQVLDAVAPLITRSELKTVSDTLGERLTQMQGQLTQRYQDIDIRSDEEHSRLRKTLDQLLGAVAALISRSELKTVSDTLGERLTQMQGQFTQRYEDVDRRSEEEHSRLRKTLDQLLGAVAPLSSLSELKAAVDRQGERLAEMQELFMQWHQDIESRNEEEHNRLTVTLDLLLDEVKQLSRPWYKRLFSGRGV